jgi:hypothetical protein
MEEWKVRQELYHRLHKNYIDDLRDVEITITQNIVEDAVDYFFNSNKGWIYPSKSYMVAICYAKWLSEQFGGLPEDYLNDETLLYNNDPFFIEYSRDPETYHKILQRINGWNFNVSLGMVPDVKKYFVEEFQID